MSEPTPKEWKRRALKAEAQLEMVQTMRRNETEGQMTASCDLAKCRVALKEAQEVIEWVLQEQNP